MAPTAGIADPKLPRKLLEFAQEHGGTIEVDDLVQAFPDVDRFAHLIPALRQLEDTGKGRFIVGRRGHPSRFTCNGDVVEKKREFGPERTEPEERSKAPLKDYEIPLRTGLSAVLRLPGDLTKAEAELLSRIVAAIPGK